MRLIRYISIFSIFLALFVLSIFFINLSEKTEVNFSEKNLPPGEIKTFEGNLLDIDLLRNNNFSLLNTIGIESDIKSNIVYLNKYIERDPK